MINCIILSGGKSTRMGKDKASLPFGDSFLLEYIVSQLKQVDEIKSIIIVSNNTNHYLDGTIGIEDSYTDSGPLGAIYTGLTNSDTLYNLVLSCDSPFFDKYLLVKLIESIPNFDCIVPVFLENEYYLMGIYSKNITPILKNQLLLKDFKLRNALNLCSINFVDVNALEAKTFLNLNTDQEYQIALKILENENNR
jgi:molybdopterin-guanine dinucleotide biosynthesis protein A